MWWFLLLLALLGLGYIYFRHSSNNTPLRRGFGFKLDHAPRDDVFPEFKNDQAPLHSTPEPGPETQSYNEPQEQEEVQPPVQMGINIEKPRESTESSTSLMELALKHLESNDTAKAEEALLKVLEIAQMHPEANQKLGLMYLTGGRAAKAEPYLRNLLEIEPGSATHFSNLAYALFMQNRLDEAKEAYEKAIQIDDTRAGRLASLAQVYMAQKNYQQALKLLQRAVEMEVANIDFLLLLAESYKNLSDLESFESTLRSILSVDPDNTEAKIWLQELEINL